MENGGGGATYVVGGQTVSTRDGFRGAGDEHLSEKLGRNRAGKRKRAVEAVETEKALSALLAKDTGVGGSSTGGKYLAILRKANGELDKKGKNGRGRNGAGEGEGLVEEDRKRPFSAGAIKRIGFDPTARRGTRDEAETAKRVSIHPICFSEPELTRVARRDLLLAGWQRQAAHLVPSEESVKVKCPGTSCYHCSHVDWWS